MFKKILKLLIFLVSIPLIYILLVLTHASLTDFQPEAIIQLAPEKVAPKKITTDSVFSFMIWNVGYGGLGAKSDFFFDAGYYFTSGGRTVISPEEEVKNNIAEQANFIANTDADFYLFQEVDKASKRSHHINQYQIFDSKLNNFSSTFATNYDVGRVPIPVFEPWKVYGETLSGLSIHSRYLADSITRYQLPGKWDWPDRIFQLDRCAAVSRHTLENGKDLLVVNIHNSAYDKGGVMRKTQLGFLQQFFKEEYAKGNYLVVGGDWNQCPPDFEVDTFAKDKIKIKPHYNIKSDFMPKDWQWVYDSSVPTNRKMRAVYDPETTFVSIIDYFLVSPNIEVLEKKGHQLNFAWSDHQPVWIKVKLK